MTVAAASDDNDDDDGGGGGGDDDDGDDNQVDEIMSCNDEACARHSYHDRTSQLSRAHVIETAKYNISYVPFLPLYITVRNI